MGLELNGTSAPVNLHEPLLMLRLEADGELHASTLCMLTVFSSSPVRRRCR